MASSLTIDPTPTPRPSQPSDGVSVESIPTVDLRLLTQSELTALSLCSSHAFDLRRCDDVVIPKIDRSVFNESAGSRKQTYSRLRLAPRNLPPSPLPPPPPFPDSDRAENARIVSVFKTLFSLTHARSSSNNGSDDELALVPVNVTYCDRIEMEGHGVAATVLAVAVTDEKVEIEDEEKMRVEEAEKMRVGAEEREKCLVNKEGEVVDLEELARMEEPYMEELRRRTEGKETAEELLAFMYNLEGQWGSSRKKRKIIDANVFGGFLPNGWKVLIAIKKKQRRAWLFCRRYVSPNGRHFVSCKDVSSYLLSLTGPQELKEKPEIQVPEISPADNVASENVVETDRKVELSALPDSFQSDDHDNRQMVLHISPNQEDQVILTKDTLPSLPSGEVHEASASALKCHKCCTSFNVKDELLSHLLSCHKRKRRRSGAEVEDDVILKDGKYECQFCNKIFTERNCYFGHVGIHVKNYIKSIGGTPGMAAKKKISEAVSTGEVPGTVSDTLGSAELNDDFVAGTPNMPVTSNSELNINVPEKVIVASPDAERHFEIGCDDQNSFSHQVELNVEAAQTDKTSACGFSVELDGTLNGNNNTMEVDEAADYSIVKPDVFSGSDEVLFSVEPDGTVTANDNTMEVDEPADYSNVKPEDCSGSDEVLLDDNNDLCENSHEKTAVNSVSSEVRKSPTLLAENADPCRFSDSKQLDLGNDDSFLMVNFIENEGGLEFDLAAEIEQKSSNQVCYDEEVKVGDDVLMYGSGSGHIGNGIDTEDVDIGDDGLTFVSGSEHIDNEMNDEDNVEDSGSLEEHSAIAHREEESCDAIINKIDQIGNKDFQLEEGHDTSFSTQERCSESAVLCFQKDYVSDYFDDEEVRGSDVRMGQPTGISGFQFEQTCSPENSSVNVLNKKGDDRTSNLFFSSGNSDNQLDVNAMTNNDQSHNDLSNELGAFSSFVADKQAQVPKSLFSCLSMNEHNRGVSENEVGNVPSTTVAMNFSGRDKVESSRSNKSFLDFNNMTEIDERYLSSVQRDIVPAESSPFQLWGQQSCGLEESQNKVYGRPNAAAKEKKAIESNSLNLVGLQRPSSGGNNLNQVCMNEQSYVQHSGAGVFRSNEARRDGISHGNTLNLAGFSQQCDSGYNFNKSSINQQSYGAQRTENRSYGSCDQARQERAAYGNSLSLASVQQCDTRYSLSKTSPQQTVDTGYSLNKGYVNSMQGMSKLDDLGNTRDRDLMIGFGNSGGRSNQAAPTDYLWRSTEKNILPSGLVDSSSFRGQSSGSFQAFDFLSDKGGNDLYAANEKFDNMSSFDGLRSSVEPMEFSFMTTQEPNTQLEHQHPKVLQYNTGMNQNFGSLPNMMGGHVITTLCVWCGNEFHQDPLACEMQAGSIGYLCPGCKARMSGQFL